MKTIQIEDDVYAHVVAHTQELGEGASPILRRLLGLPSSNGHEIAAPTAGRTPEALHQASPGSTPAGLDRQLLEFVASPEFRVSRNATEKFLSLLQFAYRQDPDAFAQHALNIRGRKRKYFAPTRTELDDSGLRLHPRQIPGSPIWAMTNASTYQKGQILREVLTVLGYGWDAALAVTRAVQ